MQRLKMVSSSPETAFLRKRKQEYKLKEKLKRDRMRRSHEVLSKKG